MNGEAKKLLLAKGESEHAVARCEQIITRLRRRLPQCRLLWRQDQPSDPVGYVTMELRPGFGGLSTRVQRRSLGAAGAMSLKRHNTSPALELSNASVAGRSMSGVAAPRRCWIEPNLAREG